MIYTLIHISFTIYSYVEENYKIESDVIFYFIISILFMLISIFCILFYKNKRRLFLNLLLLFSFIIELIFIIILFIFLITWIDIINHIGDVEIIIIVFLLQSFPNILLLYFSFHNKQSSNNNIQNKDNSNNNNTPLLPK